MRISDWSSDVCSSDLPFEKRGDDQPVSGDAARRRARLGQFLANDFGLGDVGLLLAAAETPGDRPVHIAALARRDDERALVSARFHVAVGGRPMRSEGHTSELQPLIRTSYAVFCLKKKTNTK